MTRSQRQQRDRDADREGFYAEHIAAPFGEDVKCEICGDWRNRIDAHCDRCGRHHQPGNQRECDFILRCKADVESRWATNRKSARLRRPGELRTASLTTRQSRATTQAAKEQS